MRTDVELPIEPDTLKDWLSIERTESNGYQHLLIRQTSRGKWRDVLEELISYFGSP